MTQILVKYNPYKVETNIMIDGEEIKEDSYLSKYKNERLQVWVEDLIPQLINQLNENNFKLIFNGTKLDYDDVLYYCNYYNQNGYNYEDINITLEHIPANESSQKIKQLQELVKDMKNGPFEELRSDEIEKNFNKAINSEFEIAVIATMSSGKSTLINSMLFQELMPAKNEACTAKITRIKDNNNIETFNAICMNTNEEVVVTIEDVNSCYMKEFNENNEISYINVEGNIPNISSEDMKLVLIDTPGPNNSQDSSHEQFTFKVIKNQSSKPMVLYVLNGTQLSTNDDNALLEQVAQAMKVGGKQSKDRFIFAVNKIDQFDTEEEDISSMLSKVKSYLEKHGIENPNIFPVSAELAKVIRLNKNGFDLTRKQKSTLKDYDLFLEEEDLHTLKYTPLSENTKKEIQNKIDSCNDEYEKALYHTGIPYIETAINIYLEKYATTSKITAAVDSFKKIIEEKQIFKVIEANIEKDQGYRDFIIKQMNHINEELKKGNGAKKVKDEIDKLTFNKKEATKSTRIKINKKTNGYSDRFRNKKIEEYEANNMISKLQQELRILESDIKTDLDNKMEEIIINKSKEYIEKYSKQIEGLIKVNKNFETKNIDYLSCSIPNAEKLIDRYKRVETIKVGEESYKNKNRKWYNPLSWFEPKYITEDIYEDRTYIDGNELSESIINPYLKALNGNLERFEETIDVEVKNLKDFFKDEIDKLEKVLKEKAYELQKLAQDSEHVSVDIENKNKEKEWLLKISERLDNILDI